MQLSKLKEKLSASKINFLRIVEEDNTDEYVNFLFVGMYEGKEVVYDAAIYTLRLHYESELLDIATHKAAQKFPNFKPIEFNEDENGDFEELDDEQEEIGVYMAEVMDEIDEEGSVKVKEHIEIDQMEPEKVSMECGLYTPEINDELITQFVIDYNEDTLKLSNDLYSFQMDQE